MSILRGKCDSRPTLGPRALLGIAFLVLACGQSPELSNEKGRRSSKGSSGLPTSESASSAPNAGEALGANASGADPGKAVGDGALNPVVTDTTDAAGNTGTSGTGGNDSIGLTMPTPSPMPSPVPDPTMQPSPKPTVAATPTPAPSMAPPFTWKTNFAAGAPVVMNNYELNDFEGQKYARVKAQNSFGSIDVSPPLPKAAKYDIFVAYLDEGDGVSTLEIKKNAEPGVVLKLDLAHMDPAASTLMTKRVFTGLSLAPGDKIVLLGTSVDGEWVRVQSVEIKASIVP